MQFYALEKFINLHDGYRRVFKIDHHRLLLLQEVGECHLYTAWCPHRGHPLEEADIVDGLLRCPLHGYQFSLESGELKTFTEERCRGLHQHAIVFRDTDLGVML
ncbi:MAG: Rieske 2Fe-2S domain-containing protein [Spongiibacteraceae bacterium]